MKHHRYLTAIALLGAATPVFAQNSLWTGLGSSMNWTDPYNWSTAAVPGSSSVVYFEDLFFSGYTNGVGLVNNIVSTSQAAGAANYTAMSFGVTNHSYTTLIPGGVTLTLGGLGAANAALAAGDIPGTGQWLGAGSWTNYSTITGAGSVVANDSASLVSVGMRNRATLDLTGLNTFTTSLKQLQVGVSSDNPNSTGPTGWLLLGKTNNLNLTANLSAPGVLMGYATNASATAVALLGQVNNFNTDGLVVGGRRSTSTLLALGSAYSNSPSPGNFKLRGSAGGSTPASVFSIGDAAANVDGYSTAFPGSTASATATADFSGASVDILADSIYVGRASAATQVASGTGNGTLILGQGTVTATNVYIAYKPPGSTNASIGQGTLALRSNAVMNVIKDVALVYRTNGTAFISESRIAVSNNAVLNVGGNLTTTHTIGSWTPASVALDGGTINMTGGGTVFIPSLLANNSSIAGASMVTVTNSLALGTVAVLFQPAVPGTLLVASNLTLGANMPLGFKLGANTTVGGGVNDLVGVANNLSLNNNPITLTFTAPLVTGTYLLMTNGGTQSGTVTWLNPTRSAAAVFQDSTSVGIQVSSTAPANLVMAGSTPATNWGLTNVVWNSNTEKFYQLDNVLFDDTAAATNITLVANVTPASITVSNNTKPFFLNTSSSGPAWISGFGSLTKDGAGLLLVNGQNNGFYGPVNIKKGTLRLGFANSGEQFGTAGATNPIIIFNGASFDIANYIGSGSQYGRPIMVAGTGVGGAGAILCSNATSGSTLTTAGITLTDDTTIGCPTAARLSIGGVVAPYNGIFDLGNHTLTLTGTEIRLSQFTMTNAGTINVNSASLSLQNSIIAGTGDLNLGSKNLNFNNWTTGYVAKPMIVNGGSITIATAGNPAVPILIGSTVTMNGGLTITNSQPIRLANSLTGIGSLVKYGTSNLVLEAANTYNGNTLINAGTLSLGINGALASSPLVRISPGATLDVSAKPAGLTLASGQTLDFNGSARGDLVVGPASTFFGAGTINGSFTIASGAEVAPATTNVTGTIIVSNNLALNGGHLTWELAPSFELSDALVVGGNLSLNGTNLFTVNSIGGFDPSGTNTLITYTGTLTGGLTNLALNTTARFVVEFVDPALTPGKIQVRLVTPSPLLTWKGGAAGKPTTWDIKTTPNWDNGGSPDVFWSSDLVRFDDTSATNVVDLVGTLGPGSIAMDNSAVSYLFRGAGSLVSSSLTNESGNLTFSNSAANFFTGVGLVLNGGTVTLTQPTNVSLLANLNGYGTFRKAGNNALTLVGNSASFGGSLDVLGGTLSAGSSNVLGTGLATVAPGATLDVNGQLLNSSASVTVSGIGADGFGAVNNRGAGRTNALANVTLAGDTTFGAVSNAWGIVNGLYGAGFALTKTNASDVWIMTGSDTDLGDVDVRQGRLVFSGSGTTLGRVANPVTVRANAALTFATTNSMPQSGLPPDAFAAGSKPVVLQANAAMETVGFGVNLTSQLSHDGPISITNNANFRIGGNSILTLNGPITGVNGQLILTNNGTLNLNGTNNYSSNTLVYSGTLALSHGLTIATNNTVILSNRITTGNPGLTLRSNAMFSVSNNIVVSTLNSSVSIGGDGTWPGAVLLSGANAFGLGGGTDGLNLMGKIISTNFTGSVSIEGNRTRIGGDLRFTNSMSIGVSSGLGQGFDQQFTTVRLDGDNYWTNTTWGRGRLILGRNNALPSNAPMRLGVLSAGVGDRRLFLDLNGFNQTLTAVQETAVGDSRIRFGNSSTNANSVLTVATPVGATNTWAIRLEDDLDNQLDFTNNLGLTVTSGLLVLLNTNTYTGPTFVTGGTLLLNRGSGLTAGMVGQLGATAVTVGGTGTLGGNGIVGGSVVVNSGGTIAPGASIGVLTVDDSLTFNPGSRCAVEVNVAAGTNDALVLLGDLSFNGLTVTITNLAGAYAAGQAFKIFDAVSYTGGPVSVLPVQPAPGLSWDTSNLGVDGTLKVVTQPTVAPTVSGVTRRSDGNISFTLTGTPGEAYTVRASTNIALPTASWSILEAGTLPLASYTFSDLTATNYARRFYLISTP